MKLGNRFIIPANKFVISMKEIDSCLRKNDKF